MSGGVYTVRQADTGRQPQPDCTALRLWRSCFSQGCVVCMCARATQTHLMAGWLAFLPYSVIMALLQGCSALPAPYFHRVGPAAAEVMHLLPGHLAQTLNLRANHQGKCAPTSAACKCYGGKKIYQLHLGSVS